MKTVSYATFIESPHLTVEEAREDGEDILVTREGGKPFVVSSPDTEEVDATEYLMRSPQNAERLLK